MSAPAITTFTSLPVREMVRLLDGMGRLLVRAALRKSSLNLNQAAEAVRDSAILLETIRQARVVPARADEQAASSPAAKSAKNRRPPLLETFEDGVREIVEGKRPPEAWTPLAQRTIHAAIHNHGLNFPERLAPLAGELAWLDPDFQRAFARRAQWGFRKGYILPRTETWLPKLEPNTLWCLIAITPLAEEAGLAFGQEAAPQLRTGVHPVLSWLKDVATFAFKQPGWAGYWDQWLLAKAVPLSNEPAVKPLLDLPLIATPKPAQPAPPKPASENPAEPKSVEIHLPHPGWETQRPVFLRPLAKPAG